MKLEEAQLQFIASWGAFGTHWGINRTMAQIQGAPSFAYANRASANDEVFVGPIDYQQNINGVPVNVSVRSYLALNASENKLHLKIRVVGNLSDLQQKSVQ